MFLFNLINNPSMTADDAFFAGVIFTLALFSMLTGISVLIQHMLFNASLFRAKSRLFDIPLPRWVVWLDWIMSIPQTFRNAIHMRRQDRVA